MLNAKRLVEMTRKWQKVAALRRKKIVSPRSDDGAATDACSCPAAVVASKGHVFVYANDGERFMIPIEYLANEIFRELLRMSEDEFGLPSDGPITLPCDAACMEYIISLLRRRASIDVERALLTSMSLNSCSAVSSLVSSQGYDQHIKLAFYGF